MRKKAVSGALSVNAISGTHVVLLGMDMPEAHCPGLLGFAIRREDHTEHEEYWLGGYKTFASVEPNPASGVRYSTRRHPIQGFTWSDFTAKPGYDYSYEIVALRGTPSKPEEAERVKVSLASEAEAVPGNGHQIHFNRGAAASQEYTRRFGDRSPKEVGQAAFDWLSRGAAEAIDRFVRLAICPPWGLRVCAYDLTDPRVLAALQGASHATGDVQILYHARNDDQKAANIKSIKKAGLMGISHPRDARGLGLSHNKVIVLTHEGHGRAVLTGSTNFSTGGIYGHSNVVHVCEDPTIAEKYLWGWNELAKNEQKKLAAPIIEGETPIPATFHAAGVTPLFSPRPGLQALERYAKLAREAREALFMTFAFGMHEYFQEAYRSGSAPLRYALMETKSGPARTKAQRKANEAKIVALAKKEENKIAVGGYLSAGAYDRWLKERLTGLNGHVRYVHTKYMLVDPLGPNPVVVTGSANFSKASTLDNDENMLVIKGDARVADIYLGEFMRMYNHFAFRDWLSSHRNQKGAKISHLDESDTWWKRYFGSSFASRQRAYFGG